MDIEQAASHVPALVEFKRKLEAMMAGLDPNSEPGAAVKAAIDELRRDLTELEEHVTALQKRVDEMTPPSLDTIMLQLKDELTPALQPVLDEIAAFKGMAEWFETNREGLEVLLSIDGIPDQPTAAVIEGNVSADGTVASAAVATSGADDQVQAPASNEALQPAAGAAAIDEAPVAACVALPAAEPRSEPAPEPAPEPAAPEPAEVPAQDADQPQS